jgi:hypothetical protein
MLIQGKSFKKCTKKVIRKTSLTNMSKSLKSALFRHVFANSFFGTIFLNFECKCARDDSNMSLNLVMQPSTG